MIEPSANNVNTLDRLMPLSEVAKAIGRSVREVWREISRGKLARPVLGRPARIFESDLKKYLNQLRADRDKLPSANKGQEHD